MRCSALQCVAVHCSGLQCVAVCCSVLQCVAVFCSVLQCLAVCCSVMQGDAGKSLSSSSLVPGLIFALKALAAFIVLALRVEFEHFDLDEISQKSAL